MSLEVLKMFIEERGIADAAIDEGDPEVDEQVAALKDGLAEIERLEEDSEFLGALEAAGVDNWDGYGMAYEILEEDE